MLGLVVTLVIATTVPLAWPWRAALIWAWLGSGLSFLPFVPWPLRFRIGAPLAPEDLFAADAGADEEAVLRRAYATIEGRVQELVDAGR